MKRGLVALIGAILMMLGCRESYTLVPIAKTATLSKEWTEIRPEKILRWSRPEEEIVFHIDSVHQVSRELEIIGANGERGVPDVELIADDGLSYVMDSHGFVGADMVFMFKNNPSHIATFRAVRIRSSIPLSISNLSWRGYDPANVKR